MIKKERDLSRHLIRMSVKVCFFSPIGYFCCAFFPAVVQRDLSMPDQ